MTPTPTTYDIPAIPPVYIPPYDPNTDTHDSPELPTIKFPNLPPIPIPSRKDDGDLQNKSLEDIV